MNQADHKAIAEIISHRLAVDEGRRLHTKPLYREISIDIANYCEEDETFFDSKIGKYRTMFNREQFLKDCGVE